MNAAADPAALGRQIARNTIAGYLGRAAYVIGWMALAPWMLERLGADRFGLWSLVSVVSGLYLTFDLGLQSALTRYVAEFRASGDHARLRAVVSMTAVLYAVLSAAWIAALGLGADALLSALRIEQALVPEARLALITAGVAYAAINLSMIAGALLSGAHRMDLWGLVSVAGTLIQLGAVAWALASGGGVAGVVAANGAAVALTGAAGIVLARRVAPEIGGALPPWPRELWGRLLRYSVALQVVNLGLLVMFQWEKILFGRFLGLHEAGQWELGYRIAFAAWSLPALLLPPLLPAIARLDAEGDRDRILRLHHRASRILFAVAFPLAAGLIALPGEVMRVWLGEGHDLAAAVAATLGATLAVNVLTGVGATVARGIDRAGIEAEYHALSLLLHIVLGLWWVGQWGFAGGLAALFLSTSIGSLWFLARFHRHFGIPLAPHLRAVVVPAALAAAGGGAAGWWVANVMPTPIGAEARGAALLSLTAGAATLVTVTLALLVALRYFQPDDLRQWREWLRPGRWA